MDLMEQHLYISKENPEAARQVAQRIWDATKLLGDNPWIGRKGSKKETREWVVKDTRNLIAYRVKGETVEILRIWHGSEDWQNKN